MNGFVVDPLICPVTYACVSVSGPSSNMRCDIPGVTSLDSSNGNFSFRSSDVERFPEGDYTFTLEGSSGVDSIVTAVTTFTLRLRNPCTSASLESIVTEPYF